MKIAVTLLVVFAAALVASDDSSSSESNLEELQSLNEELRVLHSWKENAQRRVDYARNYDELLVAVRSLNSIQKRIQKIEKKMREIFESD
ncbi:Hypothetical protein NTJ_04626 [Nesidiocoris tenuis]|uniref:Uncharacterized protein n=1 Tax=Nesidiocoris tenuis TaxID=355587 RepID=A0ABN7AKJ4_9HEMI|nr:Hypothetical protein NTJ_04626 [Nesidiocoris tenuis]